MLKIDRQAKNFLRLATPTLSQVSIFERADLQQFIFRSPDAFFAELGQELFILDQEFKPSKTVDDRIDLLAFDRDGNTVVIELKRGSHKLQLLQAISYAAMVSKWEAEELTELVSEDRREKLEDFLLDSSETNAGQRIILIAEGFDYEVLVTAEWLSEVYEMDILCARVSLAKDENTGAEYLICTSVYPPPELAREAIKRRIIGKTTKPKKLWSNWDEALAEIPNDAIVNFFKEEVQEGETRLGRKRLIYYRLDGKRRWSLVAHKKSVYAWQMGRFEGDLEYWRRQLGQADEVKEVKQGTRVRFFLSTEQDFAVFRRATSKDLLKTRWLENGEDTELNGDDSEE